MLHFTADKSGILTLLTLFTADKSGVWLYATADKTAIRTPADDAVRSADGGLKCDLNAC